MGKLSLTLPDHSPPKKTLKKRSHNNLANNFAPYYSKACLF